MFVNISDNKITIIKFWCFSYECFIVWPRSERIARSRTIRQVLVQYMKAVGISFCRWEAKCRLKATRQKSIREEGSSPIVTFRVLAMNSPRAVNLLKIMRDQQLDLNEKPTLSPSVDRHFISLQMPHPLASISASFNSRTEPDIQSWYWRFWWRCWKHLSS